MNLTESKIFTTKLPPIWIGSLTWTISVGMVKTKNPDWLDYLTPHRPGGTAHSLPDHQDAIQLSSKAGQSIAEPSTRLMVGRRGI
jgi:hypothetical protein